MTKNERQVGMNNQGFLRFLRVGLSVVLLLQSMPAQSAPADDAPKPSKETLIEVSVDSLEISENNSNVLGFLWGQEGAPTSYQINFVEKSIPSLFNVGQFDRAKIAGRLDAMIRNNQVRILANPTLLTKSGFE